MTKKSDIEHAKAVADAIRNTWPEKAAEIDDALQSGLAVNVRISYRVEKYDGNSTKPFEVIEGEH